LWENRAERCEKGEVDETYFAGVLAKAREAYKAVGAFTCYNVEQLEDAAAKMADYG
jgi:hypothetical protein